MGLSTQKQKTKTASTTTPVTPSWISEPIQGFTGKVTDFMNSDPTQYVAGPSALQTQAFDQAQNLGAWKPAMDQALGLAQTGGNAPASTVSLGGYNAPTLGGATIDPAAQAKAAQAGYQSIFDNGGLQKYIDPGLAALVDSTLASYDANTAQQSAAMEAEAARNKAFGGSRYGIQAGQFAADTGRNRALTEAQLRSQAYGLGLGAAMGEADRRGNVDLANAGMSTQIAAQNAGMINDRAQAQAALDWNRIATQGGMDASAAQFGANAANQQSMTNAQLQEAAYQRALEAAGISAGIGSTTGQLEGQDLALMANLGAQQQQLDQQLAAAPLTQLQAAGQLYGQIPYPAFVGQNMTGTSTTTSSPGVGNVLAGLAGAGLSAWAGGGFSPIKFG